MAVALTAETIPGLPARALATNGVEPLKSAPETLLGAQRYHACRALCAVSTGYPLHGYHLVERPASLAFEVLAVAPLELPEKGIRCVARILQVDHLIHGLDLHGAVVERVAFRSIIELVEQNFPAASPGWITVACRRLK